VEHEIHHVNSNYFYPLTSGLTQQVSFKFTSVCESVKAYANMTTLTTQSLSSSIVWRMLIKKQTRLPRKMEATSRKKCISSDMASIS